MYIYPDNLKSKAVLWLWELRDIAIIGVGALISVFAMAQLGFLPPVVITAAYLPPALVAAMRGTVQDSENRIARLLFKLAVEVNMMMNVLAAGMEISDEDLKTLRARSVREVKQTNGRISFKDAIDYQRGVE